MEQIDCTPLCSFIVSEMEGKSMTEAEKKKLRAKAAKLNKPSPVELPSGMWRCQVTVNGKRESVVDADPEVAHAKALAIKNGYLQQAKNPSVLTVGEAVDRYIESKDSVLSISTIEGYKKIKRNQFPSIEKVKIGLLTQEMVQKWVNAMARDKSPKTVRNAHGLLSAAVGAYCPGLNLRTTLPQKKRHDIAIPSEKDIKKMLQTVKGTEHELYILLAIWLGLRMSEIRGLKWEDINGDVLRVRRAMVDQGEKTTKTYTSQRDLPIPKKIMDLLNTAPHTSEYIVPRSRHYIYENFQKICVQAEVSQHYRFHDLRHINASIMLAKGVPNKYAQQRMGHATENMLKTVYQHTMDKETKKHNKKIDKYFSDLLK